MKPREAWDRLAIASLFHGHSSPWALQPSDLEPRLRPCSPLAWRQADLFVFPQTGPASFALTGHETRLRGIIEDIAKSIEPRPEGPVALLIRPDDASAREPGSPEQVPALTMQARFGEAAEALRVDRRSWHRVANALDRRPDAPAASHELNDHWAGTSAARIAWLLHRHRTQRHPLDVGRPEAAALVTEPRPDVVQSAGVPLSPPSATDALLLAAALHREDEDLTTTLWRAGADGMRSVPGSLGLLLHEYAGEWILATMLDGPEDYRTVSAAFTAQSSVATVDDEHGGQRLVPISQLEARTGVTLIGWLAEQAQDFSAAHTEGTSEEDMDQADPAPLSLPGLRVSLTPGTNLPLTTSKVGGLPYLLPGQQPPTAPDGTQMAFLAQIRCEEASATPVLPERGLLQFWHAMDILCGLEREGGGAVTYHPDVDETVTAADVADRYTVDPTDLEDNSPLETSWDRERQGYVPTEASMSFVPGDDGSVPDFPYHRVGGRSVFTQWDPRLESESEADYTVQLLQLDSDSPTLMWGDSGVGHFYVTEEQARNRDYSRPLYHWDCM